MLVQFGNNWIQKIPLTAKLNSACGLVQFWLSSEFPNWTACSPVTYTYILVFVCANLTGNAVIFKRIADMSLLKDFCNDYRTYLC